MECTYCREELPEGSPRCPQCGIPPESERADEKPKPLSAWGYFVKCLRHYVEFSGRARRKEFWFFMLFSALIYVATSIADMVFGLYDIESGFGLLSTLFSLFIILPGIAVSVRRLHDIGRSGWFYFINFIPFVGPLILLVMFCSDSEAHNKFGPNPKGEGS